MRGYAILLFLLLGAMSCQEKPYVEKMKEIKKHELSGVIIFPTHQSVLNSNSFRDGVSIKATISGDMPLTDCRWQIQSEHQSEDNVLSGQGNIDGVNCHIDEALDGEKIIDGSYYLKVQAEDASGLKLNDAVSSFQIFKEAPKIDVILPTKGDFFATDSIYLSGTISNAKDIKEISASYHGIGIDNQNLKGSAKASLKNGSTNWQISLGNELIDGEYAVDLLIIDIYGNERQFPIHNITLDKQSPKILGALDGVSQNPYAQETINYRQRLTDAEGNARYIIEPAAKALVINWEKTPTIYRWLARLDDWSTAPGYTIRVSDDKKLKEVRYKISAKCASLEESDKNATSQDDRYNIRFTQSSTDFNLVHQSEKYCLSIWAIDQAGNTNNHRVEFFWQTVASPVSLDVNAARYLAHAREDDVSWVGPPVWKLFRNKSPIALKKDLVIGHVIMANPFPSSISTKLLLNKPLELMISQRQYLISSKNVDIKYFSYNLNKNQVGAEKTLNDGSAIIDGNETIVAKFILTKELPIGGVENPNDRFWQTFSLRLGFAKAGNDRPIVDGLRVITRDTGTGALSSEFAVPWGNDHNVRRRSAPMVVEPRR